MGVGATAAVEEWTRPPAHPTLGEAEVAVWRLSANHSRPIETVVAPYLAVEPERVTVRVSILGKPEVPDTPFRVSLAHSGEVTLVAVTEGRDLGVDVERVRPGAHRWSLVDHALTARERLWLERVPAARRGDAFLGLWTRKEALLKAAGVGLSVEPALVELDGDSVLVLPPELGSAAQWTLREIPLSGHIAAVAVRGEISSGTLYTLA